VPDAQADDKAPSPTAFLYEESSGVARIKLNRPERRNALTFETYEQLTDTFRKLAHRKQIRSILLSGSGRGFCSGGDHAEIIKPLLNSTAEEHLKFTTLTCNLIHAIRTIPIPVVAALHGAVVGAGAVIAAACDIRVAAEGTKVGFVFTKVGLSGADMGAAWLLPRIVGLGVATQWLMTGDIVSDEEAYKAGFFHEVIDAEQLENRASFWARKFVKSPRLALAVTKRMLNEEASMSLEEALKAEARVQAELMSNPSFNEGYKAFIEKREPRFED
jgi:enoyl-CoA hydratase/carnithine racemase